LVLPAWYPTARQPLNGPFVRDHARAAAAYGHRVVVVAAEEPTPDVRGLFALEEERDGALRVVRVRYRPRTGTFAYLPAALTVARRLAREGTPVDVIHAHTHRMASPAAMASTLLRRPFVVSEHSSEWPTRTMTNAALRRVRIAFPRAALVCPVNERLREAIEAYGVRARFRVVPNTVETGTFHPPPERSAPPVRLVNVARHVEVKALDVLLRAFARVAEGNPALRLELIGEGPLTPELRALARQLRLEGGVEFSGERTPAEIADRLRRSHVFVLSSLSENMPLSLIEALCTGLPVAGSDAGGIPEAVGQDGVLAPAGDSETLATAIATVIQRYGDFDLDDIARRAVARWSFEAVGGVWDEIYRTV
jgi:glycosyltransferase involved in cell wall biosynthesis